MKRIWVAIVAFIIIISLCIAESFLINNTVSNLKDEIITMQSFIKEEDSENAQISTENIQKIWMEKNKGIAMLISHDKLEDLEISISTLSASLESGEYNDCFTETYRIITQLENLKKNEIPSINNIL